MIAGILAWIATKISKGLNELAGVPCNVSSVIMGKVATGKSFFVFDLSTGNIYGIIGSYLYVAMQNLSLSFVFVASLISLVASMWKGDSRGGQFLKDNILKFAGALLLLYLMPLIADAVCNIRDALGLTMYKIINDFITSNGEGAAGGLAYVDNIEQDFYEAYKANENLAEAIAYFAVVTIPISYIIAYVKVAIMQVILFGLFPMFIFASFLDGKQSLSQWFVTFFSNCLIPVIDISLIMLPSILLKMLDSYGMKSDSFLRVLLVCVMFHAIVPTRNQILKMLGNNWTISNGRGLWGMLGGAAKMAARGVAGAAAIANGIKNGVDMHKEYKEQDKELESQKDDRHSASDQLSDKVNKDIPSLSESRRSNDGGGARKDSFEEIGERNPAGDSKNEGGGVLKDEDREHTFDAHFNKYDQEQFHANKEEEKSKQAPELANVPEESSAGADSFAVTRDDIMNNSEYEQMRNDVRDGEEFNQDKDFNTDRLANLASMDNMNSMVSDIDNKTANLNNENAQLSHKLQEHKNNQHQLNELYRKHGADVTANGEVSEYDAEIARTHAHGSADADMIRELENKVKSGNAQALGWRNQIENNKDSINLANSEKAVLQNELGRRKEIEADFAKANEAIGKSGKTFNSASDFANQAKVDARLASNAKLSNYTDKKFDGVLSNQQKIDFQRKAERREMAAKIVSFTANQGMRASADVAGVVGGVASLTSGTDQEYFSGGDISRVGNAYNAGHQVAKSHKLKFDSDGVTSTVKAGDELIDHLAGRMEKREKPTVERIQAGLERSTPQKRI